MTLSVGKCWQGREPWLCFQATLSSQIQGSTQRLRGYLIVDARRAQQPLSWQEEKPESLQPQGSAAALVRKFLPNGLLEHVVLGSSPSGEGYVGLIFRTRDEDSAPSPEGEHATTKRMLVVSGQHPPQIDFISEAGVNLFRWSERGFYSVRKQGEAHLAAHLHEPEDYELVQTVLRTLRPSASVLEAIQQQTPVAAPKSSLQKEARDRIARRLKTLRKTLAQDQKKVPDASALELQKLRANSLKHWLHLVKPEMFELVLSAEQIQSSSTLAIPLDPELSPGENLNALFHTLQRMERGYELGNKRLIQLKNQIHQLESSLERLKNDERLTEQETIRLLGQSGLAAKGTAAQHVAGPAEKKPAARGRIFKSSDGASMLLGRSALENDMITKAAKSNDWWFHAASGVHGTHVVVAARSLPKGQLSATTTREAAILAIHFSNLALSKQGEVYVTQRAHLKKRKGMPAGLWQINRSETIQVRYDEQELAVLFTREVRQGTLRSMQS